MPGRDEIPDAVVLSLGSYSPRIAKPLGLDLPVYPAKGYSISVEVANPSAAPTTSVTDESKFMVFSRLGNRLRVAGTAELAGWDFWASIRCGSRRSSRKTRGVSSRMRPPTIALQSHGDGLRPAIRRIPCRSSDRTRVTTICFWIPATARSAGPWPVVPARVIADLISGRTPEIDLAGLGLSSRFQRKPPIATFRD